MGKLEGDMELYWELIELGFTLAGCIIMLGEGKESGTDIPGHMRLLEGNEPMFIDAEFKLDGVG